MAEKGVVRKGRLKFVMVGFTILMTVLAFRFIWLQIVNGAEMRREAFEQQTRNTYINPLRGNIYDRNGKELAVSIPVYTISVCPQNISKKDTTRNEIVLTLSETLELNPTDVLKKISNKDKKYEIIKKKVDKKVSDKIKEWIKSKRIKGISIDEESKRMYPGSNLASHVIGFTNADNEGIYGIESWMNSYLKGIPGKILSEVDRDGREVLPNEKKIVEVKDGANVVLTIDEVIQNITENALAKAIKENNAINGGVAIVMDPRNGEILSMASYPDYNLNTPFAAPEGVDKTKWKGTTKDDVDYLSKFVWKNKAVGDSYEPGSTFKTITTAMLFEEDLASENDIVNDYTHFIVKGVAIDCHLKNKHGEETFREGFIRSCNPVFSRLSLDIQIPRFYNYARAFGFYDKTGIEQPSEVNGIFHKSPNNIDLACASFGQRFQITPIQLISAYSAVANGGKLLKPHLVKEITDKDGNIIERTDVEVVRNVMSKQTSDRLKALLEGVVADPKGTGGRAYAKGYRIGGKTGTAETLDTPKNKRYVASFAGVAPIDNPSICVLLMVDFPDPNEVTGSIVAAPYAGQILEETLEYLGVDRVYTEKDKKLLERQVYVPNVSNIEIDEAVEKLKETKLGFIREDMGDNQKTLVVSQYPPEGTLIREDSIVTLYLYKANDPVKVKVPDLKNKTVLEATQALKNAELNIRAKGYGTVVTQAPKSGEEAQKGGIVEVFFQSEESEE